MPEPAYQKAPPTDFILPFDMPEAGVRGRLVRLSDAPTRALAGLDVPEAVARVEGECLTLVAMLGSLLKLDGRLTVQTRSSGPLGMVVADYYGADDEKPCGVRATARLDREKLSMYGKNVSLNALLGKGALAITVRPRADAKDYQGVVSLSGEGIASSAVAYFAQSEQLSTKVILAAAPVFTRGEDRPRWVAGGLLVQATPGQTRGEDDWNRVAILTDSVEAHELLDADLAGETVLWRLFHQEEVRLQAFEPMGFRCDCAAASIAAVLNGYPPEERARLADADGFVRATCEFCGAVHAVKV